MSFQSSLDMLAFDFFSVWPNSVNSRFYSLVSISLSIFSSTLVLIWKCCVPTSLVSSCFTAIWLQCIPWLLLVPFTRPTVHYPSFVLIPLGPLFLLGIKSMGSSDFVQFGFQQICYYLRLPCPRSFQDVPIVLTLTVLLQLPYS